MVGVILVGGWTLSDDRGGCDTCGRVNIVR